MLEETLDENHPRGQAEFISRSSKTDHTHVVNQLKEKCRHYNIPLCIAFNEYEKAFDSLQTQAELTSLQEQGIEDVYIELLKEIYTKNQMTLHQHKESNKIYIRRGIRQGDIYLGLNIDGEYLSHIRFADVIGEAGDL